MLLKYDLAALGQRQMLNMLANSCTGKVSSSSSIGKITLFYKCTRHVCDHSITAIPVNLDIIKHMIITKWWTKGEPTNDNINNIWEWSSTDIKQNELMQNEFQLVYGKTSLTIQPAGNKTGLTDHERTILLRNMNRHWNILFHLWFLDTALWLCPSQLTNPEMTHRCPAHLNAELILN